MGQEAEKNGFQGITLKFGKGCVDRTFTARDGHDYTCILIPNSSLDDHSPWATFVVRSNALHEDKFGKGMWVKLPSEGHTTIHKPVPAGLTADGGTVWEIQRIKVTNKELKEMVEFYKTRDRVAPGMGKSPMDARSSLKGRLEQKMAAAGADRQPQPARRDRKETIL